MFGEPPEYCILMSESMCMDKNLNMIVLREYMVVQILVIWCTATG